MLISNLLLNDGQYLFRQMQGEIGAYLRTHNVDLMNMGVGDVVKPLAPVVVDGLRRASEEMLTSDGFRGYPPTEGYDFARRAVQEYYGAIGANLDLQQICIGSGAKDELAVWSRVYDREVPAMVVSPAYPLYADLAHNVGRRVVYVEDVEEAASIGGPHIIYLCSPNNPTGTTLDSLGLQRWVDHARKTQSVILFDAAYAAFAYPYTVFACEGADEVCVEVGTLSKSASFSGMRFGWSAIGRHVCGGAALRAYLKFKSTATNGVAYVVQRAGERALRQEGLAYSRRLVEGYKQSAKQIAVALQVMGCQCQVGPYIWLKLPGRLKENPFRAFLEKGHIIVTDGAGFGRGGEGYVRLSVFGIGGREQEAIARLSRVLG